MADHVAEMASESPRLPKCAMIFRTICESRFPNSRQRKGYEILYGVRSYRSITTRPTPASRTLHFDNKSNPVSSHKVVLGLAVASRTLGSDLRQLRVSEIQTSKHLFSCHCCLRRTTQNVERIRYGAREGLHFEHQPQAGLSLPYLTTEPLGIL